MPADTAVLAWYAACFMAALAAMLYGRNEWQRWTPVIILSFAANTVTLIHLFTPTN